MKIGESNAHFEEQIVLIRKKAAGDLHASPPKILHPAKEVLNNDAISLDLVVLVLVGQDLASFQVFSSLR